VAAAGTTMPAIALFRIGTTIVLLTAITTLASVFVVSSIIIIRIYSVRKVNVKKGNPELHPVL
jgi:hypothetical protein